MTEKIYFHWVSCWHPSVSKDYGVALWLVVLEQRLVWLERPIQEWQSLPHCEPSSFVSLSQPVRQVSLQTQRGLPALPASKLNVLKPRFPIRWCQCPRPSGPSCRHLYSVIGACQWGAFLEPIPHKGDPLGSGRHPFSRKTQNHKRKEVTHLFRSGSHLSVKWLGYFCAMYNYQMVSNLHCCWLPKNNSLQTGMDMEQSTTLCCFPCTLFQNLNKRSIFMNLWMSGDVSWIGT